jgi:L-seryl-tRNA(Ser) seleniumtransferase
VARRIAALERPSLRRVINATGVVLHTNLGRAPLGTWTPLAGYSNLEYDLATGRRGKRDTHTAGLLERLLGAPAIAVNNNAAAIFLALRNWRRRRSGGLARRVDRDRRRLPHPRDHGALGRDPARSGHHQPHPYRRLPRAINERTRLLLRVHPSNFRMSGFTARVELRELTALGRERGLPVYEDLGSGCVVDLRPSASTSRWSPTV